MSIGTGPSLCGLDTLHGFLQSPRVFSHQRIIFKLKRIYVISFLLIPLFSLVVLYLVLYFEGVPGLVVGVPLKARHLDVLPVVAKDVPVPAL